MFVTEIVPNPMAKLLLTSFVVIRGFSAVLLLSTRGNHCRQPRLFMANSASSFKASYGRVY